MSASTPKPVEQQQQQRPQQQQRGNNQQRPRSPSFANYQRVTKPSLPTRDDELRVTSQGKALKYVFYAAKLFGEQEKETLTICATGTAISIAVSVCELVKRRFKGLHQVTSVGWTEIVDEYIPIEGSVGLEPRSIKRFVPSISIVLTKKESSVDKNAVGYQTPLDDALILEEKEFEKTHQRSPRASGRRQQQPEHIIEGNKATDQGRRGGRGGRGRRGGGRGRNRGRGDQQREANPQP